MSIEDRLAGLKPVRVNVMSLVQQRADLIRELQRRKNISLDQIAQEFNAEYNIQITGKYISYCLNQLKKRGRKSLIQTMASQLCAAADKKQDAADKKQDAADKKQDAADKKQDKVKVDLQSCLANDQNVLIQNLLKKGIKNV